METEGPMTKNRTLNDIMKRSSSSSSEILSPLHSPHSPFRSEHGDPDPAEPQKTPSPHVSRAASPSKPPVNNCKALITVDKPTQFNPSSLPSLSPPLPPTTPPQQPLNLTVNRAVREEGPAMTTNKTKVNSGTGGGRGARAVAAVLRRSKVKETVKMAALGFRLSEIVLCLISFSVMAADRTSGWSGDSFDRYKEYRYCLSVTVIGFVYAGFQAYALAYYLVAQKHVIRHHRRQQFDFSMDQILAYLLLSASSAAATRVDEWQSSWGKDEFTVMASASVSMAFLAFTAFAFSSLLSGYELCTHESA
ncbi:hypothetical protein HRI_003307900 [Hibiscus trionum]|uniref:CASP-like protein n=1 Tax=Hibiscus trionum TaxID=183268 RepID=A0A9W7IJU0_HIBTR|nr:hypothetical protein HRI_003307900 [Hibiscus trionum]